MQSRRETKVFELLFVQRGKKKEPIKIATMLLLQMDIASRTGRDSIVCHSVLTVWTGHEIATFRVRDFYVSKPIHSGPESLALINRLFAQKPFAAVSREQEKNCAHLIIW